MPPLVLFIISMFDMRFAFSNVDLPVGQKLLVSAQGRIVCSFFKARKRLHGIKIKRINSSLVFDKLPNLPLPAQRVPFPIFELALQCVLELYPRPVLVETSEKIKNFSIAAF